MSNCLRLTDDNFVTEVLDSELPVLVSFWGSWCPACKAVEPIVGELAVQWTGQVKVGRCNVDQNPSIRSRLRIFAAPTFIVFRDGHELERVIGAHSKRQLTEKVERVLGRQTQLKGTRPILEYSAAPASDRLEGSVNRAR